MTATPQTMELVESANGYHVRVEGELMTFAQAHAHFGVVSSSIARLRIKEGWAVDQAFLTPAGTETPYWRKMSLQDRVNLVTKLHEKGVTPKGMMAHIRGATIRGLEDFCAINLPAAFEAAEEKPEKEDKLFGWTLHSRSIDGKGQPGTGPLTLLELNDETCKFPVSDKDVEPRHMRFCGDHVNGTSSYCQNHRRQARV